VLKEVSPSAFFTYTSKVEVQGWLPIHESIFKENLWKFTRKQLPTRRDGSRLKLRIWWFIMTIIKYNYSRYFWYIIFNELEWRWGPQDLGLAVIFWIGNFYFIFVSLWKRFWKRNILSQILFFWKEKNSSKIMFLISQNLGKYYLSNIKNCKEEKKRREKALTTRVFFATL